MNSPSSENPIRVRFAPSPTGFMHLGNVRAALMNYLFARQKHGTFILRIEDTDQQRNISPQTIFDDLAWLRLNYNEGPKNIFDTQGGPYAPYFQSQRTPIYQQYLAQLETKNIIYRCFCTLEDLEKKRLRQMALRHPPRYDRTCLFLSIQDIERKLTDNVPFIWRFKLNGSSVSVQDMARGAITYDLNHFSDFALTRPDGSFTFIFANFVDDLVMRITHVIRGEDHLSNTANQAALYHAFNAPIPFFWHLPIICNIEGKKLSKRDFGFSLNDLRDAGFLPEAICNYLAIIGGSFEQEVMNLEELAQSFNFNKVTSTGHVRYDVEKLRWLNHQWIMKLDLSELVKRCKEIANLKAAFSKVSDQKLEEILRIARSSLKVLSVDEPDLGFYFGAPPSPQDPHAEDPLLKIAEKYNYKDYQEIIRQLIQEIEQQSPLDAVSFTKQASSLCKAQGLQPKNLFELIRLALTGQTRGHPIADLITLLEPEKISSRLQRLLK